METNAELFAACKIMQASESVEKSLLDQGNPEYFVKWNIDFFENIVNDGNLPHYLLGE